MLIKIIDNDLGEVRVALNSIECYFENAGCLNIHLAGGAILNSSHHEIEELDLAFKESYQMIKKIPSVK